ncbi:MAG TPA: tRNA lysidine(34) synthetase TilS, partial [Flavobacteriales bacterium]|nr:tRNA lysidine(34) synthetase TilS [Flavobacteriales bacterium]
RGMGLHGWETIPPRSGPFIRPLLGEGREEIAAYAGRHGIPHREDASNADPKYLRNRVRHELLPLLESWRPGTRRTLGRSVELLRELDVIAHRCTVEAMIGIAPGKDGSIRIPFQRITGSGAPHLVLYHALRDVHLHPDRFEDILHAIAGRSVGASFPAGDHVVYVDRDHLVIAERQGDPASWSFEAPHEVPADAPLRIMRCLPADIDLGQGPSVAWLDGEALRSPLELRRWRNGDRMRPVGLGGSKLVSDILVDGKVSLDRKAFCHVLVSDATIVWLCGHRIAEGFQAKPTSRSVWRCSWQGPGDPGSSSF